MPVVKSMSAISEIASESQSENVLHPFPSPLGVTLDAEKLKPSVLLLLPWCQEVQPTCTIFHQTPLFQVQH